MKDLDVSRSICDVFKGYDHKDKIPENEWFDEKNMSSRCYPLAATRGLRGVYAETTAPAGIIAKDALAYVDGSNLIYNGYTVAMNLSTSESMVPKQLISMGAYLLVWPDKKYLNTQNLNDFGSMENTYTAAQSVVVTVSLCNLDGDIYENYTASAAAPEEPTDGQLWLDLSGESPVLKEYSTESGSWVGVATSYLKISAAGINTGFEKFDGVTISGFTGDLSNLNQTYVVYGIGAGYLIVTGTLTGQAVSQTGGVTASRTVPDMDFVTECENRVWGCKYGMVNGKPINEIYACKLGDFRNWNCFMGLSTDSYSASRGSDGVFTGAITHLGHPLFFKEGYIEKVYPAANGAHQIVTTVARGVQRGCWRSLHIVGETLFYKSVSDVCAYAGSLPESVSDPLGSEAYHDARAGAVGGVYYISMADTAGNYHLFTLDTERGVWHKEDDTKAMMFAECDGELYWIDETTGKIVCANGAVCDADNRETQIEWEIISGYFGMETADRRSLMRLIIRLEYNGNFDLIIQYDDKTAWERIGARGNTNTQPGTVSLPVRPRRCDHFRIKLKGRGKVCKIYSISKYIEKGSDVI